MAILETGRVHPPAFPSQNLIHVEARDARDALWAMEEGVRCSALSCVIGEIWGGMRDGYTFKGIQTGGVSAGPLKDEHLDLPVDFDSLTHVGGMLGGSSVSPEPAQR